MPSTKEISNVIELMKKELKNFRRTNLNREAPKYTPYQTLISCLLSLRSQDETTEKVSAKLFEVAKTPEAIVKLPLKRLEKLVYSSGYYKNKAKVIKGVSKKILEKHKGKVPQTEQQLLALHGVGRKTANIVLCLSFNKEVIPIDTHCHRIPNRLGWVQTKNPDQTEIELMKIIPKRYWKDFNEIFVLYGKNICLPISPWCSKCPVSNYCKRINLVRSR